jgi:ubiquinone biosynthesis protein
MKITTIPQIYRNANRWREILTILSKYGLAGWIGRFDLPVVKGILKNREGESLGHISRETRIRLAIEELGPTFIKLGQILSTRPDQVGIVLADELQKLQTDVPADDADDIRKTIETELGAPLETLFVDFDTTPLASASIGQVHRARLAAPHGNVNADVVVKVQHAGIERRMAIDLDILAGLAQLAEMLPELAPYRPQAMVAEFRRVVRRELDFAREARNLDQFARNFRRNTHIRIPHCYHELSTQRVLTMEWLDGCRFSDPHLAHETQLDLAQVARHGAEMYLEMIFHHGFYHADPHPGNLVLIADGTIGLLDFGMVGRIDERVREDIESMLLAIVTQDAQMLTSLVMRLGAVPSGLDEAALSVDLSEFVAHYANQPADAFDLAGALSEMVEIIQRYHIVLPSSLAMLIKVLIMLDGTGRLLAPHFSLMELVQPYQRKLLQRRLSPARQMRKMRRIFSELEQLAEVLPRRLRDILQQVESGKFDVHLDHRGLEPSVNRLVLGMMTSALFLGSSLMLAQHVWPIRAVSVPGVVGMALSMFLGWRLLKAIGKSGRLERRK